MYNKNCSSKVGLSLLLSFFHHLFGPQNEFSICLEALTLGRSCRRLNNSNNNSNMKKRYRGRTRKKEDICLLMFAKLLIFCFFYNLKYGPQQPVYYFIFQAPVGKQFLQPMYVDNSPLTLRFELFWSILQNQYRKLKLKLLTKYYSE